MNIEGQIRGPCARCGKKLRKLRYMGTCFYDGLHKKCWKAKQAEEVEEAYLCEISQRPDLYKHGDTGPPTIVEYIQAQPQREAFVKWLRNKQDAGYDAVADTIEAGPNVEECIEVLAARNQ
jgi:hypothetical protein